MLNQRLVVLSSAVAFTFGVAAAPQVKRDQLAAKVDAAGNQAEAGWDQVKVDVATSFSVIEGDLNPAR
jgi:hypothetical protein